MIGYWGFHKFDNTMYKLIHIGAYIESSHKSNKIDTIESWSPRMLMLK